jgi:hypothetical protein
MSPALLSKRLKELTLAGVVERVELPSEPGTYEYRLTESGRDLHSVIQAVGVWGQRWVQAEVTLENLDSALLMWDMRRNLRTSPLPRRRCVIAFKYPELPSTKGRWWLIVNVEGDVDLCSVDPGFEVDLSVTSALRTMTSIWLGLSTVHEERDAQRLVLFGDKELTTQMQQWLGLSVFAGEEKRRV